MIEVGRIMVKIAGRDAGKKGVIIGILDDKFVLVDGETRRRKANILHIEPLNQVIKIEKNASHEAVAKALEELGIKARQTKPKPKTQKPKAKRKTPEQLREQKEDKAGLAEAKEEKHEHGHKEHKERKEAKPNEKKVPKKTTPKKNE